MTTQQLRAAVTRLRGYVMNGGVAPTRPAGCTSPESRQFDFWIGEWDVSPSGQDNMVLAESSITLHDQGCVIIENWRPPTGSHGRSINIYDSVDQQWHQTYAGAGGRRAVYAGAFADGVMSLRNMGAPAANAPPGDRRMNFRAVDQNTVRQWGERFDQATNAWVVTFDFTYRRRPNTSVR
ncbi:hypothetical protein U91I_04158 [alpha proteobacterium U9-1i]|nr:hypothetical protein U91I_04158 [alpha proteobacterium U9-1i]